MNTPISVYIVDDHQMLIDGIKALLANNADFTIVGESLSSTQAIQFLKKNEVEVLITDISMPEISGLELVQSVRRFKPEQKVLALTMFCDKAIITDMADAGVSGYILKNTGKQELVQALKTIAAGNKFFSEQVQATMNQPNELIDKRYVLSAREREIVHYVAQGLSHTEIGEKISISPRTVDTHRTNIMRKLEVHSIAELIKLALQLKIIE